MSSSNDPRDSSLEIKVCFPKKWSRESNDALSASAMFLSGLILVTRNRYLAWPALMLSICGVVTQHPLRTREGAIGVWSGVMLSISAVFAAYLPFFLLAPAK